MNVESHLSSFAYISRKMAIIISRFADVDLRLCGRPIRCDADCGSRPVRAESIHESLLPRAGHSREEGSSHLSHGRSVHSHRPFQVSISLGARKALPDAIFSLSLFPTCQN